MGTKYPPSFGNNEVVTVDDPIVTVTGITPQPYVTIDATSAILTLLVRDTNKVKRRRTAPLEHVAGEVKSHFRIPFHVITDAQCLRGRSLRTLPYLLGLSANVVV